MADSTLAGLTAATVAGATDLLYLAVTATTDRKITFANLEASLTLGNQAGTLGAAKGGTGVANNAASTLTISGNFATTLTVSGITSVTLPTTGTLATLAGTETLSGKRITERVVTTTDDATAVIDIDVTDTYQLSAVANATEFTVTGTPTDGQKLTIRLKDAGVSKALTWTFATAIGVTLPTATTAGKWHYIGCIYNSSAAQWHAVAVSTQA